jgi:hypothetical protein
MAIPRWASPVLGPLLHTPTSAVTGVVPPLVLSAQDDAHPTIDVESARLIVSPSLAAAGAGAHYQAQDDANAAVGVRPTTPHAHICRCQCGAPALPIRPG